MFDTCIKIILNDLNRYIKTKAGLNEDQVVYATHTDLATEQETTPNQYTNKVIMSLVDIVHQETAQNPNKYVRQGDQYIIKSLPINFYLYLLFSANFKGEHGIQGLNYLTKVIAFFHSKSYFTSKNTPDLPYPELEGMSVSLVKFDNEQKSALWGSLNATYMPSVLYKVGLIPVQDIPEAWPTAPEIDSIYKHR